MNSHRERAAAARMKLLDGLGRWPVARQVDTVAEETYPTELVKAAEAFLEVAHTPASYAAALDKLRAAMALYEPEEG